MPRVAVCCITAATEQTRECAHIGRFGRVHHVFIAAQIDVVYASGGAAAATAGGDINVRRIADVINLRTTVSILSVKGFVGAGAIPPVRGGATLGAGGVDILKPGSACGNRVGLTNR